MPIRDIKKKLLNRKTRRDSVTIWSWWRKCQWRNDKHYDNIDLDEFD